MISFWFLEKQNGIESVIEDIEVPEIPEQIVKIMESQIFPGEFNLTGYDWFEYYDLDVSKRVRVKLNGLSSSHYSPFADRSFSIKFGKQDYKFKSLASEINMGLKNKNEYSLLQEVAVYNVAKQFYEPGINAGLGRLNNSDDRILILWDDQLENSIRENTFVNFGTLSRLNWLAKDKQSRYFLHDWIHQFNKLFD